MNLQARLDLALTYVLLGGLSTDHREILLVGNCYVARVVVTYFRPNFALHRC